mgnify:CR=1 FL=1
MGNRLKKWIRPALFTIGGALIGIGYYFLAGCSTGSCAITSTPLTSMAYMGIIGWLLSGIIGTGCKDKCNM